MKVIAELVVFAIPQKINKAVMLPSVATNPPGSIDRAPINVDKAYIKVDWGKLTFT